jgi:hypothetical protein
MTELPFGDEKVNAGALATRPFDLSGLVWLE